MNIVMSGKEISRVGSCSQDHKQHWSQIIITLRLNGWNLPLLHRWWMGCGGNIQICTQRLLVLSSLLTLPAVDIVTLDKTMLSSALQPDGKTLISICYCLQAGVSSYRIDNNKCHFLHLFKISCILIVRVSGPALMCAHSILSILQCIKLLVSACDGSTRVVMTF